MLSGIVMNCAKAHTLRRLLLACTRCASLHAVPILGKEYAKADSRYATRDAFIVQMELVTAFAWGPGSLAIAAGLAARAPWRYSAMMVVSLGQLYGDVLYYLTCFHLGKRALSHPGPGRAA